MSAKIKICGITTLADATLACDLGADMLGFNFYPRSPRYLAPAAAAAIIADLPKTCIAVAVMVNPSLDEIRQTLDHCPTLQFIQLHGDETPDFCQQAAHHGPDLIKALRIAHADDLTRMADYPIDIFLLDAFNKNAYGGTGQTFNWDWLTPAVKNHKILLAGGLSPDNIEAALQLGTWGVDLCSGIESQPGKKDHDKMKRLFEKIARYDA